MPDISPGTIRRLAWWFGIPFLAIGVLAWMLQEDRLVPPTVLLFGATGVALAVDGVRTGVVEVKFGTYSRVQVRSISGFMSASFFCSAWQPSWLSAPDSWVDATPGKRRRSRPMLEWWKDLVRPIRRTDPQFGKLRYLRDARFWEGHAGFTPIGTEVEVLIPGEPSGPTDQQRAFFDDLQKRYDSLWPELHKVLEAEARRLEIDSREFVLVCTDLPAPGVTSADCDWALSYETKPSSWHFTVRMTAWMPAEVVAEC